MTGHVARASAAASIVLAASILASSCAATLAEPRFVPVPPRIGASIAAREIRDYSTALATVADAFEREIGLPRPEVTLVLFPNRRSFEAGLVTIGYEPRFARQSATSFRAIGGATGMLVNEGSLRTARWPERVQLLAHELVHCVQYAFARGVRGTSEQWLREGFAEIISMQVTDHLGLRRYSRMREALLTPLTDVHPGTMPVPFRRLSTFPQWAEAQTLFDVPVYSQAFVGAELLLERHGRDALVRYFELFGESMDKDANFHRAFGMTLDEFDREFAARWQVVLAQTR